MGRVAQGKTLVNLSLPNGIRDKIDVRAKPLRLTRATYALMIIERWDAENCPAVSEPDRLMQISQRQLKK